MRLLEKKFHKINLLEFFFQKNFQKPILVEFWNFYMNALNGENKNLDQMKLQIKGMNSRMNILSNKINDDENTMKNMRSLISKLKCIILLLNPKDFEETTVPTDSNHIKSLLETRNSVKLVP